MTRPSVVALVKLAGGPNQAHLELLKIFAYGTLSDYSGELPNLATLPRPVAHHALFSHSFGIDSAPQ